MPHQFDPLSYVTDADELVFLVEEVPRKLRRLFDASTRQVRSDPHPMARACLHLSNAGSYPDRACEVSRTGTR
jgi:hypothetical protein